MSGGGGGLGAGFSYQKFVHFALEQTRLRSTLVPHLSQKKFKFIKPNEDNTVLNALSFSTSKIRLLRSLTIEQKNSVQVLDFAAFSEPEYDLPIFCANAFSSPARSIVVLDLNPLYDTTEHKDYREKYYRNLMPLIRKYSEVFQSDPSPKHNTFRNLKPSCIYFMCSSMSLIDEMQLLPWGGKITSESLRFFSPIVIWTIFEPTEANHQALYSAFVDYYKVWLELMDGAVRETCEEKIDCNREAQHKYLTWRAEKDPGYPLLKKLVGESGAKDLVREFLFEGVGSLGTKSFLEYFPEYAQQDGTVNRKRSMAGKSFGTRPWDAHGQFVGDAVDG